MAKRKPSPKATYVYVKDETAPVGSKKRGVTGGIKKEKTSPEKGSRTNVVSRRNTPEEISAANEGVRTKAMGERRRKKADEADFGDISASRRGQLEDQLKEAPFAKAEPAPRKKGLKATRADVAAGPATVPASGTGAGSAPSKPDRGAEFGGAITVGKGSGAPDALSGTVRGSKVTVKEEPITVKKRKKDVPLTDSSGKQMTRKVYTSAPDIKTTPTDTREMRSAESIKETRRKASGRVQAGLKTTEYRPMDIAARSTSGDRKKRRAEKKLQARIASGKVKTPERIGMGAVAAASAATEVAAGKNKTATPTVSGSDVSAYMYSDEALAHELSRTHFSGHSASDIMDYVKHTGSSMPAFHKHVTNAHRAETETIPVGPPTDTRKRSAGKITRWRVSKKTGELESVSSYRGWHQTHARDEQDRNVKVWKKFDAPKGSISHIEYLHGQITKHKEMRAMEASDTRERNRSRGTAKTTAAIIGAMGASATPAAPKEKQPPKGKSGKVKVSRPRPEGAQGPELASGKFSERVEDPNASKFTEVKKPRKRNLNY